MFICTKIFISLHAILEYQLNCEKKCAKSIKDCIKFASLNKHSKRISQLSILKSCQYMSCIFFLYALFIYGFLTQINKYTV